MLITKSQFTQQTCKEGPTPTGLLRSRELLAAEDLRRHGAFEFLVVCRLQSARRSLPTK